MKPEEDSSGKAKVVEQPKLAKKATTTASVTTTNSAPATAAVVVERPQVKPEDVNMDTCYDEGFHGSVYGGSIPF